MIRKRVLIIGHFGWGHDFFDGQTIKTRLLFSELKKQSNWDVKFVDTFNQKKKRISIFLKSLFLSLRCKDIIIALSTNGLTFYIPFLNFIRKIRKTRIYHYVVGGSFHHFLFSKPKFIPMVKQFKVNWVQTKNLVKELKAMEVDNAEYMPNFKPLKIIEKSKLIYYSKPPFLFCTFSRVMKEKGIGDAIEAINHINKKHGSIVCKLDIYGHVDSGYKKEFDEILKTCDSDVIRYCGAKDPMQSSKIISNYFACLFPTFWDGEGFAATVLDANFGGVPVIATDWNCNSEIISDGITGLIYPNDLFNNLEQAIEYAISNIKLINSMKERCLEFAKDFLPDEYIAYIISFIETKGIK